MKNKAPLPLMEQLVMVLVFALTGALCLQGFALADRMSQRQQDRSQAVILAQNAAELLKHTEGDYQMAAVHMGGSWDSRTWTIAYDEQWQLLTDDSTACYLLQAIPTDSIHDLLDAATIQVFKQDDILFEITVTWQEVTP